MYTESQFGLYKVLIGPYSMGIFVWLYKCSRTAGTMVPYGYQWLCIVKVPEKPLFPNFSEILPG